MRGTDRRDILFLNLNSYVIPRISTDDKCRRLILRIQSIQDTDL